MTSDKRDFSNFEDFPGEIINNGPSKGWYKFPEVKSIDSMGRTRVWTIYLRLVKTNDGKGFPRRKINWDISMDVVVPLLHTHFNDFSNVPENTIAQIWTVNGIKSKKTDTGTEGIQTN